MKPQRKLAYPVQHAAIGCLVGQAVGDALGARYEFQQPGRYSQENPLGQKNMFLGGGSFGWKPGQFTDDTEMATVLAEWLISQGSDEDLFSAWREWSFTANDVGGATGAALSFSDLKVSQSVRSHPTASSSRGNGAVMRVSPVAIMGSLKGLDWTAGMAHRQATITHHDWRTVEASVITAVTIAQLINARGQKSVLSAVEHAISTYVSSQYRKYFMDLLINGASATDGTNFHGDICLRDALKAVTTTFSYEDAVRTAIDFGHDADTVGAVTGAIAGAIYGVQQIPSRWATFVHGVICGNRYDVEDLQRIATTLAGGTWKPKSPSYGGAFQPALVHSDGVYASNLAGIENLDLGDNRAVISMCRTFGATSHNPNRRVFYILDEADEDANPGLYNIVSEAIDAIDEFLEQGLEVVVHCHAGRSRTALVLKSWYMRKYEATHDEAHSWLTFIWPHVSNHNTDFTKFLNQLESFYELVKFSQTK